MLTPQIGSELNRMRAEALRLDGRQGSGRSGRRRRAGRVRLAVGARLLSAGLRLTGEGR
ncbi:MAG: hypothetical protein L0206_19595 [Actinobacteria bacterium]|jgi:hypothetical protein|nr:hypothetical protein [Actinomycetota bacterium]